MEYFIIEYEEKSKFAVLYLKDIWILERLVAVQLLKKEFVHRNTAITLISATKR